MIDTLDFDEINWVRSNNHDLARRLRLHMTILANWPTIGAPLDLIKPLIDAMRWGMSSHKKPPRGVRLAILREYSEGEDIGIIARTWRMPLETVTNIVHWGRP